MSKEIDYISFTGQQYIFSGVTVNGNSTIEITCAYTGTGSDTGAIFGSRTTESGTDSTSFTMFVVNGAIRIDHFGTSKTLDKNKYNPNGKHTYKITPDTVYCDGTKIYTHTVSSNSAPNKLHIGAVCTNGTISKLSNVNIYSFKFYDGSNLILNLIPYKDNNKKYCFKDLVNNKLYYSGAPEELKGFDSNNIKTGDILNFNYTGAVQSITLPKGIYTLECWGAQGGNRSQDSASATVTGSGLGGYSIGTLTLTQLTTCYIYVGGQGGMSSSTGNVKVEGGFNGGGFASHESTGEPGNGGGGATDVRIAQDSLYARIIVAGGGGGSGEDNETGGYGGGETGGAGSGNTSLTQASQTSGGTNSFGFGLGGNTYNGGAGGGGWYGGVSRYSVSSYSTGSDSEVGGGGSGYVYTSSTAKNYPSGCLLNSSYYLTDAQTIAGNNSFVSPTGSSETGHSGNGYCRITVIECKNTALYARINNSIKKATAFYFKLNNNKMYGVGSANYNGSVMNFDYTGSVQTATLTPGAYKLECWGGQGGTYSSYIGGYGGYSKGTITLAKTTTVYVSVGGAGSSSSTTAGFNGGGTGISSGRGGGGATDVRIGQNSLYSRVIVAGGGGGAGVTSANANPCGCGGGEYGGDGYYNNTTGSYTTGQNRSGGSASQTAGGITWSTGTQATFGQGGNASGYSCGGGGGGWYGGQGTYPDGSGDDDGGGGGGSGYVYTSSSASNYPQGCLLNSSYYLSDASNLSGNESFKSPSGTTETGHSDNGYCRITCYIKKKTLHCKMNNEIKKAAPVFMKMNNKIYDAGANAVMDFAYTGTAQAISLPRGKYTIECWGAQGGSYSSYYGGAGGYSVGTITLTKNSTDLYIYVGGQPEATTSTGETPGGFNGGGKGCSRTYNYSSYGQGGGGATDVRIEKNDLYARVIVAGGGGGSSSENSLTTKYGGGTTGGSSASGYGATQTAAGTNGSFGQGGSATTSGTNYNYGSGGGGGGWYGGGACSDYSDSTNYQGYNGGGSGYVYTSATAANYPSGNYVNSSYYLTNAQTIAGNQSFKSPDGTNETGHTGNGFCRITRKSGKIFVKQNGSWIKV